ncbi:hypothetical protein PoB_003012700 [Plakobranchus ocellatus]|uniref:Uncharacterized protein n=1 Tax=Plakobranchus ocellatus TaxID=259542 RepID=A0AAV4A8R2_9GAST|nr:hypothetical protein PoB_003012700 [Plakobranchus ocellatus]
MLAVQTATPTPDPTDSVTTSECEIEQQPVGLFVSLSPPMPSYCNISITPPVQAMVSRPPKNHVGRLGRLAFPRDSKPIKECKDQLG